MTITMGPQQWLDLFTHFLTLSLLAVGGAITTAPEMHRYLVTERQWLTDTQFSSSIALAQAAPGPNVLFIALMGWNIGLNAAGGPSTGMHAWALGCLGVFLAMTGILLPSTTLTYAASRWGHRNRDRRGVRAFKLGLGPVVIGLLVSTGWILASSHGPFRDTWHLWLLTVVSAVIVWKTKTHMLWLLAAGGVLGWMGWV